jgi:hypothetical protein
MGADGYERCARLAGALETGARVALELARGPGFDELDEALQIECLLAIISSTARTARRYVASGEGG